MMGRVKRDREFWESATDNNRIFNQYYNRLCELAISMFDWQNLPDTVDARYLELTLFTGGAAVFFRDEILDDYLALTAMIEGDFDVYGIPRRRTAYSKYNNYHKSLTIDDSVIIYNNMLHTNSMLGIREYAKKLTDLDRTITVNARAQKTPVLINADENERLSLVNLYKEFDGNAPVIYGQKGLNQMKPLQVLKTEAPYIADRLYQLKTQIWNEALTYLGITNVNTVKKERLITDEVSGNQGDVIASRFSRLESRREACRKINKMFGLNVDVEYREDYRLIGSWEMENPEEGDPDNE